MRLGILAGTFDPVHAGHIAFAKKAIDKFMLDKVIFMPEQSPRSKTAVTDFKHRLSMIRRAIKGNKQFRLFDSGDNYFTFKKTLPKLNDKYPESSFVIMVGSDVARFLADWPGVDKLGSQVSFLVALRAGDSEMSVRDKLSQPSIKPRISYLNSTEPTKAASQIRGGLMSTGLTTVDDYISKKRLY